METGDNPNMQGATDDIALRTELRARVYKLLSDCFDVPDDHFHERIRELKRGLDEICPEAGQELVTFGATGSTKNTQNTESLKVEFTRLFLGPFKVLAPPYGSMYLEHRDHLMTDSTMDVHRWYEEEGMDVAIKEVPDHIRIELEFVYLLIYRELQAKDEHRAREYRDKQRQFLNRHPGRWLPAFSERIRSESGEEVYKELAAAARTFIESDIRYVAGDQVNT